MIFFSERTDALLTEKTVLGLNGRQARMFPFANHVALGTSVTPALSKIVCAVPSARSPEEPLRVASRLPRSRCRRTQGNVHRIHRFIGQRLERSAGDGSMPRGDKSKYTDKQDRKAEHIEKSYEN